MGCGREILEFPGGASLLSQPLPSPLPSRCLEPPRCWGRGDPAARGREEPWFCGPFSRLAPWRPGPAGGAHTGSPIVVPVTTTQLDCPIQTLCSLPSQARYHWGGCRVPSRTPSSPVIVRRRKSQQVCVCGGEGARDGDTWLGTTDPSLLLPTPSHSLLNSGFSKAKADHLSPARRAPSCWPFPPFQAHEPPPPHHPCSIPTLCALHAPLPLRSRDCGVGNTFGFSRVQGRAETHGDHTLRRRVGLPAPAHALKPS